MTYDPKQIIELAKIMEDNAERIDWDSLPLDRDTVYDQLSSSVLEVLYDADSDEKREIMLAASVVQLLVLNFIQNIEIETFKRATS